MRIALVSLMLAPLVFGANPCPTWTLPDPLACPYTIDLAKIKGTYIGWLQAEPGVVLVAEAESCDPEGLAMTASVVSAPAGVILTTDANKVLHFQWTPTWLQIGMHYLAFKVTDTAPAPNLDPNSTTVTVFVVVRGVNHAPQVGGCRAITQ